ncbi:hypothetical protein OTU49_012960 [Cherax quadricarinatus]|uniref:Protein CEBPZOS n=2 Tax=Cherax quadricarinatus TaxID=27406 RepID=A0AAW0VX59_CHEQU
MKKYPRSQLFSFIKKSAAVLFALEVGAFGGLYYVYNRMNTDRDFRYYMSNNYSFGLEVFYSVGEYLNKQDKTREFDQHIWSKQFPVSDSKREESLVKQE